jgi:hypothetical protein
MRKIVEPSLRQAGIELEKVVKGANGAEALAAFESMESTSSCAISTCRSWTGWNWSARSPRWKPPKLVDIVILGNAWTVTPIVQAATQVQVPAAAATKTAESFPAAVLEPTVMKSVDSRLQP